MIVDQAFPTRTDPTAWRASWAIGGPWGRHGGARSWWTPLRWVLAATMLALLLGFSTKVSCATGTLSAARQYSHMCGSEIVPLWTDARLDSGAVPYRDTALGYPVLTGGFVLVAAQLARGLHALHEGWSSLVLFGVGTDVILALAALAVAALTALTARGRPYDAAIVAAAPLLVLHAFTGWDLLAVAAVSGALLAWSRRRPVLAGALVGLGSALAFYPALVLVALAVLALRTRIVADVLRTTAAAVVVWVALNAPIAFSYHSGWTAWYRTAVDAPAERTTLWAIVRTFTSGSLMDVDAPSWVPSWPAVVCAVAAALLGVAWCGLRAPVRPRLPQLLFLCVVVYLLAAKAWAPADSLWLLPLLALARPRWRLTLLWQFAEVLVWVMIMLVQLGALASSSGHGYGVTYGWLIVAVLVRDAVLIALAALIIEEMWHPEADVVRAGGADDPAGGVFDGAPDYWADDYVDDDVDDDFDAAAGAAASSFERR